MPITDQPAASDAELLTRKQRQEGLFLWQWSRKRVPGRNAVALRGALIGGAGGVVFALAMLGVVGSGSGSALLQLADRAFQLLVLAVPAFAGIGWLGALRVYNMHEVMYHGLLAAGATVPTHKPVLGMGDRGPAIAVAIVVVVIIGFIGFVFFTLG